LNSELRAFWDDTREGLQHIDPRRVHHSAGCRRAHRQLLAGRLLLIDGATAYGDQKAGSISGLESTDDYTIRMTLEAPGSTWLLPLGDFRRYGHPTGARAARRGAGPTEVASVQPQSVGFGRCLPVRQVGNRPVSGDQTQRRLWWWRQGQTRLGLLQDADPRRRAPAAVGLSRELTTLAKMPEPRVKALIA
jgi:hypothetical protein